VIFRTVVLHYLSIAHQKLPRVKRSHSDLSILSWVYNIEPIYTQSVAFEPELPYISFKEQNPACFSRYE
jgi:hypothetical protein